MANSTEGKYKLPSSLVAQYHTFLYKGDEKKFLGVFRPSRGHR